MSYFLVFRKRANEDIEFFKKSGDKILLKKIETLLQEIQVDPYFGTGKPERLKYSDGNIWSRRIDGRNRLIYNIEENIVTVEIIFVKGHYDDK